jgi:hypothetical protein
VCGADIDFRRWDSGPSKAKQAGSWLSALSFGGTQQRVHPLILWGLVLFGGSIVAAVVAAVSGLFG